MGAIGYVALKIKNKVVLYYIDWTNTRREYRLDNLTNSEIEDIKRLFGSETVVLIPSKSKTISLLRKRIGEIDYSRAIGVKGTSSPAKMLFTHLSKNGIPGGFYNHRRGTFLSIISTLNLHILIHGLLSKETIMLVIKQELKKYWKKSRPETIFEGFIRVGLLRKVSIVSTGPKSLQSKKGPYFSF